MRITKGVAIQKTIDILETLDYLPRDVKNEFFHEWVKDEHGYLTGEAKKIVDMLYKLSRDLKKENR